MNLRDFSYAYFGWMGRALSKIFKGCERDLDAANIRIYHEVYMSLLSFGALLSLIAPAVLTVIYSLGLWPDLYFLPMNGLFIIPFSFLTPVLIIVLGAFIPKISALSRVSGLKIEIPYASMYMSVMTSGGLSPYHSLLRLRHTDLMPNMKKEVARIETIAISKGVDPLTAMEQAARVVNLSDYKELLLGYASSVRTGGDTLHYLFNQTENMFRRMSTKVKSMGENMGVLMEAYTIIGILGVLGLFLIYVVGLSLPNASVGFSPDQFFLFSFVVLPMMSFMFIYFGDTIQISYPVSNFRVYLVLAVTMPIAIFMGYQMLPFFVEGPFSFTFAHDFILWLRVALNFAEGTEAPLILGITLIMVAVPPVIADQYFVSRETKMQEGITHFLRDLLEVRKSGLGPERCIDALSKKDYKGFSKHLRMINLKLNWGYPIREIYAEFRSKVRNWLALVNIYLLIDTIEVGGGTEESLETLADFAESTKQLENEKKSTLMPLTIVPYIGAALLTGSTVLFLQFFTAMSSLGGVSIQYVTLYRVLLTPLVLHSFILGLVTGKIVSGRVSAGFKHAILLTLVAIGGTYAVSNFNMAPIMGKIG